MSKRNEICAIIEEGCKFEGNLSFSGIVRIAGVVNGSVFSNDTVKYLNDKVNIPPVEFCYNGLDFIKKYLIFKNFVLNASSVVFRKQDFFPYEILNMQFSGDWYFWIFLLKNGNIKFLPHRYNKFRFHPNSTREFANFTIEDFKFKEYFKCIKFASIVSGVSIAMVS